MNQDTILQDPALSQGVSTGVAVVAGLIGLAIGLAIMAVICYFLAGFYKAIPEPHRKLQPNQVWLLLIPLFNIYWIFKVFPGLSDSFKSYFDSIGRTDVGDCGRSIALWYCISTLVAVFTGWIPCIGMVIALAPLVFLILFLVKASDLKRKMLTP